MDETQVVLYKNLWAALLVVATPFLEASAAQVRNDGAAAIKMYKDEAGDEFMLGFQVMEKDQPVRDFEIRLMCAGLHEGEAGANLKVTSHKLIDGQWVEYRGYAPYNYTDQCWTSEASEIAARFSGADLSPFVLDMVE